MIHVNFEVKGQLPGWEVNGWLGSSSYTEGSELRRRWTERGVQPSCLNTGAETTKSQTAVIAECDELRKALHTGLVSGG